MPDDPASGRKPVAAAVDAADLGPLGGLLGVALRRAQAAVARDLKQRLRGEGIRPADYPVLVVLALNPGLRASRVALALGIKRTNFVPVLDGLERRGLVERRAVEGDRRAAALFLTEAGVAMLGRLRPLIEQHQAEFHARLGAEGHSRLIELLRGLAGPG